MSLEFRATFCAAHFGLEPEPSLAFRPANRRRAAVPLVGDLDPTAGRQVHDDDDIAVGFVAVGGLL